MFTSLLVTILKCPWLMKSQPFSWQNPPFPKVGHWRPQPWQRPKRCETEPSWNTLGSGDPRGHCELKNPQKTHRRAISGVTTCWFPSNLDQKSYVKIYGQWQYILRIWWCITQLRSTHCTKSMQTMLHLSLNFQPEKCNRTPRLVHESFRIPWFPAFILMILEKPIPRIIVFVPNIWALRMNKSSIRPYIRLSLGFDVFGHEELLIGIPKDGFPNFYWRYMICSLP